MRNRNEAVRLRTLRGAATATGKGRRLELILPAATTIAALLLGAAINSLEARRLERQKFEFEVLKYVVGASRDRRGQLRMLCQFSDFGFIPDADRRYHRAEINGARVCGLEEVETESRSVLARLKNDIGISGVSIGAISFERGVMKIGGQVGDVREPRRSSLNAGRPSRIDLVAVFTSGDHGSGEVESAGRAANADLVVDRNGRTTQLENVLTNHGAVRIGLLTSGRLTFGTEQRGVGFRLNDGSGRDVPRSEGVGFHQVGMTTVGRQRMTEAQLIASRRLVAALCRIGRPSVRASHYLTETAAMSRPDLPVVGCG